MIVSRQGFAPVERRTLEFLSRKSSSDLFCFTKREEGIILFVAVILKNRNRQSKSDYVGLNFNHATLSFLNRFNVWHFLGNENGDYKLDGNHTARCLTHK